jgi:hypothetical protein
MAYKSSGYTVIGSYYLICTHYVSRLENYKAMQIFPM